MSFEVNSPSPWVRGGLDPDQHRAGIGWTGGLHCRSELERMARTDPAGCLTGSLALARVALGLGS
jgi:hypothetical protein